MPKYKAYYNREREAERREKQEQKSERKRRKVIRANYEPLLPVIVKELFWAMLILLPVTLLVEIIVTIQDKRTSGPAAFFLRSSQSRLAVWLFFAVPLLALCLIQLIRVCYYGYKEKTYKFSDEISGREADEYTQVNEAEDPELILYAGPEEIPAKKKYMKWTKITLLTGCVMVLYYLAAVIIRKF